MNRLIYVAGDRCATLPGVAKKIRNEIQAFKDTNIDTELIYVKSIRRIKKIVPFSSSASDWRSVGTIRADFLYARWEALSAPFLRFLCKTKKENPGIKIVLEIGTYPYIKELRKLSNNPLVIFRDKLYSLWIKNYVDRIVIFTDFDKVYGIPTIRAINCTKVDDIKIPIRKFYRQDNVINMVAVASVEFYYGYDRLLQGISDYYKSENYDTDVHFHLAGNGNEIPNLKAMCKKLNIESHVTFYGYIKGKELDDLYEIADVGIDGFGGHRKDDFYFGTLKSREYMAKGIPFVTEYPLPDNISPIYRYILKVPADESAIDVKAIIDFFKETKKESRESTIRNMRGFAYSYCDISVAMKPIINYLKEE